MQKQLHYAMTDALSQAMMATRVTGQVLLQEGYCTPWALDIPSSKRLSRLLGPPQRAVAFHLVRRGSFKLSWADGTLLVPEGHVAIGFGGVPHRMGAGRARAVSLADHLAGAEVGATSGPATSGSVTQVVCGAFTLEGAELSPFIQALPDILCVDLHHTDVAQRLLQELDSAQVGWGFAVSRLLELMCLEAIRAHVHQPTQAGWFAAAKDRELSRAMTAVHGDPGAPWTVPELARRAGLSTSRFATRFRETLHEPPMHYVTRLRMHEAGRLLRRSDLRVSEVAIRVGYQSTSSFSRVFRQHAGMSPRTWRATEPGENP